VQRLVLLKREQWRTTMIFFLNLMKYLPFISLFILFSFEASAQQFELAPEIWSKPMSIDSFSQRYSGEAYPSLTQNFDTLYFYKDGDIFRSIKMNNIWQASKRLNSNVNNEVPTRHPSISKDGKRLYYSAWGGYGQWDIYYNDWNDSLNDWGPRKNMGPIINSSSIEYYLYEVSKDTIYTINSQWATLGLSSYKLNYEQNKWTLIDSFYFHPELGHGDIYGISIPKGGKKLYYAIRPWEKDILTKKGIELCVSYWDTLSNTWGTSYFLNINTDIFWPDSNIGFGGIDEYPWISNDGTKLFFDSNTESALKDTINTPDIFVSHLIIDENGDSVTHIRDNIDYPKQIDLRQNYPNPFNPRTRIQYHINEDSYVKLNLYDVNGKEITTLVDQLQKKGEYSLNLNAAKLNLSSGIYFYRLQVNLNARLNKILTKKMIYLR
jgi:Secretion system C-terminal sorting domain/WD40-like Beta Propeller Repeat